MFVENEHFTFLMRETARDEKSEKVISDKK